MPINPLAQLFGAQGAQTLRQNPSLSAQRQRAEETMFEDTDEAGYFDPRNMDDYLGGEAQAAARDPFADRYRQIGQAQTEAAVYNEPQVAAIRKQQENAALEKLLAPIHARGQYDLERQAMASQGQIQAAQAQGQVRRQTQQGQMQRTQATQQGQMQRQQNQQIEARAKAAEGSTRGFWDTILPTSLGGKPSPADQAAQIRSQQNYGFDAPGGGEDETMAAATEFAQTMQGASDEEILAALQEQFDADDPSEYLEVLAAIREIQGQ
jgi:hypothetical protein